MQPPRRTDLEYIEVVRSLHDYTATEAGVLNLKAGDIIYVHSKDSSGWWSGTVGNEKGSNILMTRYKYIINMQDGSLRIGLKLWRQ